MKPDPILDALEKVAAQFGKPHPAGTGLGLSWDEIEVMNAFLDAAVEDFRKQLVGEVKGLWGDMIPGTIYASGYRAALSRAISTIEDHHYH